MVEPREKKTYLRPFDAAALVALSLVFGTVLSALAFIPMPENIRAFVSYAAVQAAILAVLFIYIKVRKQPVSVLGVSAKPKLAAMALTPVMAIGAIALFMIVNYIAVYVYAACGIETSVASPSWDRWENVVLSILTMCILPAFGEELLFRGAVLGAERRFGDKKAIIIAAVVFALYHFNLAQTWYQLFYGTFIAFIVVKTDNVWYAVSLHFFNNLFVQLLALIPSIGALDVFSWANMGILLSISLGGMGILTTSGLLFLRTAGDKKLSGKAEEAEALTLKEDRIANYALIGGLAIIWIITVIISLTGVL